MIKPKFKSVIITLVILIVIYKLISFFSTFHFYAAGTYPYAETYYFEHSEKEVITALQKLKLQNANFLDTESTDYWHEIYFDLDNKKLHTWTRSYDESGTTFALVAVYKYRKGHWELVNQDLGLFENIMTKRKFEKEIIEKLKIELEK